MKIKKALVYTIDEVKQKLSDFYKDVTVGTVNSDGCLQPSCIPTIIFEKGIQNMTTQELIEIADGWCECEIDEYNYNHKHNPVDIILMVVTHPDFYLATTYVLGQTIYKKEME